MWSRIDWPWVREWSGRIFLAAFPLGTFLYFTAAPVLRPGGAIAALGPALAAGCGLALAATAIAAAVLAFISARRNR